MLEAHTPCVASQPAERFIFVRDAGLKYWKPTSPGQRFRITIDRSDLWQGGPKASLVKGVKRWGGRNHHGRITVRHRGGGLRRKIRKVDWVRCPDEQQAPGKRHMSVQLNLLSAS